MVRVKLSIGVVVAVWLSLAPSLLVTLGILVARVAIEAASPAPIETPRADGPIPVSDPSVGDGGVSTFYLWDKMVPGTAGTLLRQEPLDEKLMLANASKGLRVLYTSTNGLDDRTPIAVSGAVYFPKGAAPASGRPIIAWAHGTTGIADVCAPSWIPRSSRDADYLNAWLAQGYAIVATDYQGLGTPGGHPWNVVRPEAYSVLDSVRAAIGAFPELSNSVVIIGQSQGAHAAISASLLAPAYATDVHLKGTVATGVLGDPPFVPATKAPQIPVPPQVGGAFVTINLLSLLAYRIIDPSLNPSDYLADAARPAFGPSRHSRLPGRPI
jgi:Secretory lipase